MPAPITVNIPHRLGKAEARRRITEGFGRMQQQMASSLMGMVSFSNHWENDRLHFEGSSLGQKISGSLDILEDAVQLQVELPALLAAIADRFRSTLQKQTQLLLERSNLGLARQMESVLMTRDFGYDSRPFG